LQYNTDLRRSLRIYTQEANFHPKFKKPSLRQARD
jgi:hypothetical protein